MDVEFRPSPDNLAEAMRRVEALVDALATGATQVDTQCLAAALKDALREIVPPTIGYVWTTRNDEHFVRAMPWSRLAGWDDDTRQWLAVLTRQALLAHSSPQKLARRRADKIIAAARAVGKQAERIQAELGRSLQVGRGQQERARAAGRVREPLTRQQQREAAAEIALLVASGKKPQTAARDLQPKYGVSYKTLGRYYRKTIG